MSQASLSVGLPWLTHMCHDSLTCAMAHCRMMCAMSHGTHTGVTCHDSIYDDVRHESCAMTLWVMPVLWLTHMCHDSLTCAMTHSHVPWLTHLCHDSLTCAMTYSHVPWLTDMYHDSLTRAMTHSHVPWLTPSWCMSRVMKHMKESTCGMTLSVMVWLFQSYLRPVCVYVYRTLVDERVRRRCILAMGWLRSVGSTRL